MADAASSVPCNRARASVFGFLGRRDGSVLIEAAFGFPLLILTTLAVIETGAALFVDSLLEGAVREASRFGVTGAELAGLTREDAIREIIAGRTMGFVDPDNLEITTTVYGDFKLINREPFTDLEPLNADYDPGEPFEDLNANGVWDSGVGDPGLGGSGEVVVYGIAYDWPLLTGVFNSFFGGDTVRLTASIAVRNEPYDLSPGGPVL